MLMFKIRSKFYKKGDMVFISHLDLLRLFERAMRRAQIPIAYSQGFNPHPIMAFATALSIGISSDAEYIDLTLYENMDEQVFKEKLNKVLPEGLKLVDSKEVPLKEASLMSIVKSSSYLVRFLIEDEINKNIFEEKLKDFENLDTIIIKKEKRKRKGNRWINNVQEVNIRESIKTIELANIDGKEVLVRMKLTAGEVGNIKPEIVVEELANHENINYNKDSLRIHRINLLNEAEEDLMK